MITEIIPSYTSMFYVLGDLKDQEADVKSERTFEYFIDGVQMKFLRIQYKLSG